MNTETLIGWDQYQERAQATAIFPQASAFEYLALGLASEAVEVVTAGTYATDLDAELGDVFWYVAAFSHWLNVPMRTLPSRPLRSERHHEVQRELLAAAGSVASLAKKAMRDDAGALTDERRARLIIELGRARVAAEHLCWQAAGRPVQEVLGANLAKLADRAQRGALGGDGDKR